MTAKSIKRNYIYNTAYSILTIIAPLITAPYISRVLQADGIGIVSFSGSIAVYFGLFAGLGASSYGQREISYVRDDIEKRSHVFWENVSLRVITATLTTAVYIIFVCCFVKSHKAIFFMYAGNFLNVIFDVSWFLAGLEEFGKIIFRNIIIRILEIIFIFTFVKSKSDIELYVFCFIFFNVAGSAAMWKYMPGYITGPKIKYLHPFRNIRTVLSMFFPAAAVQVYTMLDKTMIGILTEGTFENGYYEQALKISKIVLALVTSLAGVMIPRIGYLFGKNDHEQISLYMYRSYKFVWFIGVPLCLGLIGISDNFVPWFFGPGYEKVAGLLKISSFIIIALGLSNATGVQYLIPTKRQHLFTYSIITGAVINFSLNVILIRMYQSYGAITASVIAEASVACIELFMIRRELSMKRILMFSVNYFIAGGVMLSVLLFMNARLTPSFINTFTMVFTGAAVYFLSLLILRDKFFLEYSARPFEFVRRKFLRSRENDN